jgi:hypothetical protein
MRRSGSASIAFLSRGLSIPRSSVAVGAWWFCRTLASMAFLSRGLSVPLSTVAVGAWWFCRMPLHFASGMPWRISCGSTSYGGQRKW